MKTIFIFILILSAYLPLRGKEYIIPKVDERVEFLNIVYTLARYGSYTDTANTRYMNEVNAYFLPYKTHPAVLYTKNLADSFARNNMDIRDWELPSLAVHLSSLTDFKKLSDGVSGDGWDDRTLLLDKYIILLKDFYNISDAAQFFASRQIYYDSIAYAYQQTGVRIDKEWFTSYFNCTPTETYYPILSLNNTAGAYMRVNFENNHRYTFTLFGCDRYDEQGMPLTFTAPYFAWSMLHETIHCYSNQMVDHDSSAFKLIGETLLKDAKVKAAVKNTFYNNWQYLMYETLVRAVAIRYAIQQQESAEKIKADIQKQEGLGFVWMGALVKKLAVYEKNRNKYKSMEAFMPQIKKVVQSYCHF